jgi:hypothetical protein
MLYREQIIRHEAEPEDVWENLLARQVRIENHGREITPLEAEIVSDAQSTYAHHTNAIAQSLWNRIRREYVDNLARVKTMMNIIGQEEEFAEIEKDWPQKKSEYTAESRMLSPCVMRRRMKMAG